MTASPQAISFPRSFIAAPGIRQVAFDAPWDWLARGWKDLRASPGISMAYGALFTAAAYLFVFQLLRIHALPLFLPLAGGFMLLGPLLAVGFYEISRRNELNEQTSLRDIALAVRRSGSQIAYFGVMLLLLYFFWMQVASLLFMLFFGNADIPPLDNFIPTLLFAPHGLGLLVTGTAVGALFAFAAFGLSAIAAPMLLDRKADVITAVSTSLKAVNRNRPTMILWASIVTGLIALGFVTLFAGLAIAFPLIGHATWHAYRDLTGTAASPGSL